MGSPRWALVAVVAGLAVVGACSADDVAAPTPTTANVGTAAPPAVCAILAEGDETVFGGDTDELLERHREARAASPVEIQPHWDVLIGVYEQVEALDPEDPSYLEELTAISESADDPEVLDAQRAIDAFATEECGLDIAMDPSQGDTGTSGGSFDDTGEGEAPNTVAGVYETLQAGFGSEAWYEDVIAGGAALSFDYAGDVAEWVLTLEVQPAANGMAETDLLAVCDAMAAYLDGAEVVDDVEITVEGPGGVELAVRAAGEPCETA
jgi:hypothetical protein